ncbi:NAD(P)/FAD-dependent oxidoreductase [Albimonas sp. CAU 1670]|uniref:flavin-containing monooxygenase n=1 Tax=Albimonas sp. CAU 1670 TaxID=3032599 RepID=UPI0023DA2091|nr:NAD(P)/FAD-dependent oxidoreductase [Albimonas sp. CAU 1670]MDF2234979.1 NAD(P)/FAD-dependent oxidoreductase [Albimonas sp. CAU 1670]
MRIEDEAAPGGGNDGGGAVERRDAVVVGTGVCGIYQLHRLREMGLDALALDANPGPGGTWWMNRYPGARFDSESYTYGFSFSKELLEEWNWSERFSGQPENLRYLDFVVDRLDLRRLMRFDSRVTAARWDDARNLWRLEVEGARPIECRWLFLGIGVLSRPTMPRIAGVGDFQGPEFHTYDWPHEGLDLAGKRVGIIGTGATGIQIIAEIADKVGELTVFQRRPNWSAPLNNSPISAEEMARIKTRYDEIFATCAASPGGFEHIPAEKGFWEATPEERRALWDRLYDQPGFGIWLSNYREIFTDEKANALFSDYIAERIRGRVKDQSVAEKLIPKDHGFGWARVPLETRYFEAYNRDNVELVDVSETPIERITPTGIRTSAREFELDVIVYATGFDAVTGAFEMLDVEGIGGRRLNEKWTPEPLTWLGMMTTGFPNLFTPSGPQSSSATVNYPRSIEMCVNFVSDLMEGALARGATRIEPTQAAEDAWVKHVREMYEMLLLRKSRSWFTGYNSNVEGREIGKVRHIVYNGGGPKYQRILARTAAEGYRDLVFDRGETEARAEAPPARAGA